MFKKIKNFFEMFFGKKKIDNRDLVKDSVQELNWNQDVEDILKQYKYILNQVFQNTNYWVKRNDTIGEKCINIYKTGQANRIGHLWPIKTKRVIHMNFTSDICEKLKKTIDLPKDSDVKPGKYMNWRAFRNIDYDTAMKILKEVAKLD